MARQERPKKQKKQKRKLTPAERAAKKRRREEYTTVFVNGKQKRVPREPTLDGLSVDEYVRRNADPIWLHMHEMWEPMDLEGDGLDAVGETVVDNSICPGRDNPLDAARGLTPR